MEQKMILSKETLLYYLNNELGDGCALEVTVPLNSMGCWSGRVNIKQTVEPAEDLEYMEWIVRRLKGEDI